MKRIKLLKTALMISIGLVSFGMMAGCVWGGHGHYDDRYHHDDRADVHVDVHDDAHQH